MKLTIAGLLMMLLLGLAVSSFVGCGPAPPCDTSLITLDETRLDAETYEQEAAETAKKVAELEEQLAAKKKEIAEVEGEPEKLAERVHELKKGSGRE
jgi:septal ring factor EnvC (AmiA/AmiB activator)